jgi:uncharacterized coiled-coil DUF342 family protein
MSDQDWHKSFDRDYATHTQETQVNETTQELPAVSKLREAFDTARNAILEGTELAKLVTELRGQVNSLQLEVGRFQRDMEYLRDRNKELDEQVTQVRRQRDEAIADASEQRSKVFAMQAQIDGMAKERDDAMVMALEYETKWKTAEAKLAKIEEAMHGVKSEEKPVEKPVPHYVTQPRDEVGKFEPTSPQGSQSEGSGF